MKLPGGADARRHFVVDAALRDLSGRMTQLMFEFMDLTAEVLRDKLYVRMHYQDADEYFEQRVGFSWRSLRRRLTVREAVERVDADERADLRQALIGVGIHRAAILAPLLGKPGQDWREWVKRAKRLDEDALQEQVTKALGAKARGRAAHDRDGAHVRGTDETWLEGTLKLLPEDAREEVEEVFEAGLVILGHPDKIPRLQVLLALIRSMKVEWYHAARECGWKPRTERVALAPAAS